MYSTEKVLVNITQYFLLSDRQSHLDVSADRTVFGNSISQYFWPHFRSIIIPKRISYGFDLIRFFFLGETIFVVLVENEWNPRNREGAAVGQSICEIL